ncbi:hypothetical protein ACWDFH_07595 [Streptomyces kronopolitis]|uniref:hypothetical protein n=1 Tax=Streptomyces kronopolitis TaxID=1612435 RepID=UPI003677B2CA
MVTIEDDDNFYGYHMADGGCRTYKPKLRNGQRFALRVFNGKKGKAVSGSHGAWVYGIVQQTARLSASAWDLSPPGGPGAAAPERFRGMKMPLIRASRAGQGHDREAYFFFPWFFTASMAALAASGSR